MIASTLLRLSFALAFGAVAGDDKYSVPRGAYPFMAFIYYSDETVVDSAGNRFLRGAVLIRNDWLVSSAIAPDDPDGFPRKTLLARAGSTAIDANFTLNEDEFEQEREIIQIIRPYNHSATEWWRTDISLMKTLRPFTSSSAVGFYTLNTDHYFLEKSCTVLVFVKTYYGNWTEDKILKKMPVEMLSPSLANCGNHFINGTMACAADSDDDKESVFGSDFCQGNSGGPLMCGGEVRGLQTYIGNNCKQPYLYQLLTEWKSFINCGVEEKCQDEECAKVCDITNKDAPTKQMAPVMFVEQSSIVTEIRTPAPISTVKEISSKTDDLSTEVSETMTPTLTSERTTATEVTSSETTTTSTQAITTPTTTTLTTETTRNYVTEATTTTTEAADDDEEVLETTRAWPKEKPLENKIVEQEIEREVNAEAHRQELKQKTETSPSGSTVVTLNVLFLLFTLACLI